MSSVCLYSVLIILSAYHSASASDFEYGVVIDAGSSGSRVRLFKWPMRTRQFEIPDAEEIDSLKIKPGLSDFSERQDEIEAYIGQLLSYAIENIPAGSQATTAIYFLATAGIVY